MHLILLIIASLIVSCTQIKLDIEPLEMDESVKGEILWKIDLPSTESGNPLIYNNYLVIPLAQKNIQFIDLNTGKKAGKLNIDYIPKELLILDNRLYSLGLGSWNSLSSYRLYPKFKKIFQKSADPLGGKLYKHNGKLLFITNRKKMLSIEPSTGEILDRVSLGSKAVAFLNAESKGVLILENGRIYSSQIDSEITFIDTLNLDTFLEIPPVISEKGDIYILTKDKQIFKLDSNLNINKFSQLEIKNPRSLYYSNNHIYIQNLEGEIILLDKDLNISDRLFGIEYSYTTPLIFDKKIIILSYKGEIIFYNKTGNEIKRIKLKGIPYRYINHRGKIYIPTDKKLLYCID